MQRPPRPRAKRCSAAPPSGAGWPEGGVLLVVVLAIYVLTLDQGGTGTHALRAGDDGGQPGAGGP